MKVSLLGDSIRQIGYGKRVEELLGKDVEVFQPEENCRFAKYTLRMLFDYQEQLQGSDIIHWNNGLWDVCDLFEDGNFSPLEEYVETMLRIAKILKSIAPVVIFATTTPVRTTHLYNRNSDIEIYNRAIVPELQKMGIIVNDLHATVSSDIDGFIREDDKIHLTERGIEVCAEQVYKSIIATK